MSNHQDTTKEEVVKTLRRCSREDRSTARNVDRAAGREWKLFADTHHARADFFEWMARRVEAGRVKPELPGYGGWEATLEALCGGAPTEADMMYVWGRDMYVVKPTD